MNLVAVIFARHLGWLVWLTLMGEVSFWFDLLEYLSLYFWYDNIITGTLTDCILVSLKPFEEIGNGTRLRKGPETIKRWFYTLLNSFGWFVCVRVKTFNSKFVRDASLKFPFVLPLSDFYIEQYWPHLISWEWFPTLSFSWRDYVKLILIFKIFVRILWSTYLGLKISFSKVLCHSFNLIKVYGSIQMMYLSLLQVYWDYVVWYIHI